MATVTINGTSVKVKNGTSILNAAKSIDVKIPTLCYLEEVNEVGACGLCVVEVEGEQDLVSACNTLVFNKMRIYTDTKRINKSRIASLEAIAKKHEFDCSNCSKEGHCEFYNILKEFNIEINEKKPVSKDLNNIISGLGITEDISKCILCERCINVCEKEVTANVLKFINVDDSTVVVSPTVGLTFDEAGCINCGQCISVCPTGALYDTDQTQIVEKLLKDKKRYVIAQTTTEIKSALIEQFDLDKSISSKKLDEKLNEALYLLGFDHSLDVSFANDLTTIELAFELEDRILSGIEEPLFSSVCPSAVTYINTFQKNHIKNISKIKGPHLALGALLKTYYNDKFLEIDNQEITVVSIVSCPARKVEIEQEGLKVDDVSDVDAVITISELALLLCKNEIDFKSLTGMQNEKYFVNSSGASIIYGLSGGLTTSLIRTLYNVLEKKELSDLEFKKLLIKNHTLKGSIREIKVKMLNIEIRFAVVDGGASMKDIFEILNHPKKQYHFIELMACASGCINGGSMPIVPREEKEQSILNRANTLYLEDRRYRPNRKAHLNKSISNIYEDFLKQPRSKASHKYLYLEKESKDTTKK